MKCIKRGAEIKRVSDREAELRVENGDWSYVSKIEWKEKVRDIKVKVKQSEDGDVKDSKPKTRAGRRHLKSKQNEGVAPM